MKPRDTLALLVVLAATVACARLGFWQLSRFHEKQTINAASRARLAAPPLEVWGAASVADSLGGRRVTLHGRFDPRFGVLLRGREREGSPGIELVTPFVLAGDSGAVLVDRGWLAAEDGATLPDSTLPRDSATAVTGWIDDRARRGPVGLRPIAATAATLWSAFTLHPDSLRAAIPLPLAPFVVNALPAEGAPAAPRRFAPEPLNESMHLGYALQWFLIGALVLIGSVQLARVRGIGPFAGRGPGR